jgi:hypothetical protein
MIALTLVRVIERHARELAAELVTKLGTSLRTADLRRVPVAELQRQIEEVLLHLSDCCSQRLPTTSSSVILNSVNAAPLKASLFPTFAGRLLSLSNTSGNSWSGRASVAAQSRFTAKWNGCACWTSF